jgi:ATP-dependent Clp protease ATP-binding subunit ClpB
MTSNLGAESLVTDVDQEGVVSDSAKTEVMHSVHQAFAPEFVNRIDEMVNSIVLGNHDRLNVSHLFFKGYLQPPVSPSLEGYC